MSAASSAETVVMDNFVFAHEVVTRAFPEDPGTPEVRMIYAVPAGLIARSWSSPGAKNLAVS